MVDKKLNIGKKLIYFQIVFNMFVKFLIAPLGLPSLLNYVTDIVTLMLLVVIIKNTLKIFKKIRYMSAIFCIGLFSLVVVLGALYNGVPPTLFVWAIRNTFRFFVFFVACIVILEPEDVSRIFSMLYAFQYLNIVLCLYEYFILGYKQDYLGGLFGVEKGCNGGLNLYFCLLVIYGISGYLSKKVNLYRLTFIVASTLLLSALAELKFFYVEFVIIVAMCLFLAKPTVKLFFLILASLVFLQIALMILEKIFPEQYAVLMDFNELMKYFSSTEGGYKISRGQAFSRINQLFFHDDLMLNLFGFGFGNCEMSQFFTSDFFLAYEGYHYRAFAHAMIFLETGFIGLTTYILFYVDCIRYSLANLKILSKHRDHIIIVIVLSFIMVINLWYNMALRIEYAYMLYFVLAIVAIDRKTEKSVAEETAAVDDISETAGEILQTAAGTAANITEKPSVKATKTADKEKTITKFNEAKSKIKTNELPEIKINVSEKSVMKKDYNIAFEEGQRTLKK